MNYYQPRQIQLGENAGKWHYTCRNDDRIWPVGFCRDGCEGHDTSEEAAAHQREYDLDHRKVRKVEPWSQCAECGKRTPNIVELGPGLGIGGPVLCDTHLSREVVQKHYPAPGVVISS